LTGPVEAGMRAGGRIGISSAWSSTSCVTKDKACRYYWAGKSPGRMVPWL